MVPRAHPFQNIATVNGDGTVHWAEDNGLVSDEVKTAMAEYRHRWSRDWCRTRVHRKSVAGIGIPSRDGLLVAVKDMDTLMN